MKLLDVNVWLAASWARHRHHALAKKWVDREDDELAFCRVTLDSVFRTRYPAVRVVDLLRQSNAQ